MDLLVNVVIEYENRVRLRRLQMIKRRFLRDMSNPFDVSPEQFRRHYRMYQQTAIELINLIIEHLPNDPNGVPPHLQVLCTLRFLAEGPYQKGLGTDQNHCMSQTTISRYLHRVIPAINTLAPTFIRFPETPEERDRVQRRFAEIIGFPGVLGAVDCTLPKIVAPADHEEAFLNYKRQHSLNVQIVADVDYNILNTRICSGSTNDRFVCAHSEMREEMYQLRENRAIMDEEGPFYIIGDGGYTQSRVLLVPVRNAVRGTPAHAFSVALRRARVKVENVFGILKAIWRCLNKAKCLHYTPQFASEIVQTCAVLYNFLRRQGMPIPQLDIDNNEIDFNNANIEDDEDDNNFNAHEEFLLGVAERQRIINEHFNVAV